MVHVGRRMIGFVKVIALSAALALSDAPVFARANEGVGVEGAGHSESMSAEEPDSSLVLTECADIGANDADAEECLTAQGDAEDLSVLVDKLPDMSGEALAEHYYYDQLDALGQVLYWKASEATYDAPSFTVCGLSGEQMDAIEGSCRWLAALQADQPRHHMLWQRYCNVSVDRDAGAATIELVRLSGTTDYVLAKCNARIRQLVTNVGEERDVYVRYRKLATLLTRDVSYDWQYPFAVQWTSEMNDSAIGPFFKNSAICAGLADALKVLCDELAIPCVVTGNAGHAWNIVQVGDAWYATDLSSYCGIAGPSVSLDEISESLAAEGVLLMGTKAMSADSNYLISEQCLYGEGDFVFPEVPEESYVFDGTYDVVYGDAELEFEEPELSFTYTLNEDGSTCRLTGYVGVDEGELFLPTEIDGYPVTAVGDAAFANSGFTGSLVVGAGITSIGESAFMGCTYISEVILPEGLEHISNNAFNGCTGITRPVVFPESLVTIGDNAFYDCTGMYGTIRLPDGLEYLGTRAFWQCYNLSGSLNIPDGVVVGRAVASYSGIDEFVVSAESKNYTIMDGLLYDRDATTLLACPPAREGALSIPEGVTHIDDFALQGCEGLTGVLRLPSTLVRIGNSAFFDTSLEGDLFIPNSVTEIGDYAFMCAYDADANDVERGMLSLSSSLVYLGEMAFSSCRFVGNLIIPDGVESIPAHCFNGCGFDGALVLPSALQSVGSFAFYENHFTSCVDLYGTDIELAEYAFTGSTHHFFRCNCGVDMEPVNMQGYEQQWGCSAQTGYICPRCGGIGHTDSGSSEWIDLRGGAKGFAKDGKLVTGWMDLGSSKFYFQPDGSMSVGWTDVVVDGRQMHYYFNPASGNLVRNTWFEIDGRKYYFRPSGNLATGWATIADNGVDKKYFFEDDGTLVAGCWRDIDTGQGYMGHYYLRPSGAMATGWATIDGQKYWFRPSGNMATGFADVDDAFKRYFSESGIMLTGWQQIGSSTYYFRPSGAMQTGEATIDGEPHSFSEKGVLIS